MDEVQFDMVGSRPPGAKGHRGRIFILVLIGVGGLATAAWIAFLIWFVFFYLL
jgi:hypothetical protein